MDCDCDVFIYFSLKNDGWKPAAQFITYEYEQLECLPSLMVDGDGIKQGRGRNCILFMLLEWRAWIKRNNVNFIHFGSILH